MRRVHVEHAPALGDARRAPVALRQRAERLEPTHHRAREAALAAHGRDEELVLGGRGLVRAVAAAELLELTSSDSPYGSLSGFTIDKKIGKGQFSVVYRARAVTDERSVALKKVQIFEMMDSKARLDCMKEIQLLQQLNHPNVIKYLASFIEDRELHIVLEIADAGALCRMRKHLRKHRGLPPRPKGPRERDLLCDQRAALGMQRRSIR